MESNTIHQNKIKIIHIITGLQTGGAEMMLFKLLSHTNREVFVPEVISLLGEGPIADKIRSLNIPIHMLNLNRKFPNPAKVVKLAWRIRKMRPDIVQTWMYHADLLGGIAAWFARLPLVFWNIRHSNLSATVNKKTTLWTAVCCAKLSYVIPSKIVCCAEASRQTHIQYGYDKSKLVVIPNGFDLDRFKPDANAGFSMRQELGISEDTLLIGMIGRFDPQKDHENFIRAAQILNQSDPDVRFLLCGADVNKENNKIFNLVKAANMEDKIYLLGSRSDIPRIMASLNIVALSSCGGEGFPNVIGEAMACGIPCVVTDVGDSAIIVGETGIVVPPKDSTALAKGWAKMIESGEAMRVVMGQEARKRIRINYCLPAIAKLYEDMYKHALLQIRNNDGTQ
jgi:glycosyltransferase involved in cell wall biosynthesis